MERCDDSWTGCTKLKFDNESEAQEYANYLSEKYNHSIRVYWSKECDCFHFTSS